MKDGKLDMLEGFTWGPETTSLLDLHDLDFEVYRSPIHRVR